MQDFNIIIYKTDVENGKIKYDYSNTEFCGFFNCSNMELTSLEHCPTYVSDFFSCSNNHLTSLEQCPDKIRGSFYSYGNRICTLKGIGKDYCFEINGVLDLIHNPLLSNILGILYIKGLKTVAMDNKEVEKIINKHLEYKDIAKCRQELIDAGFKEYAKL